MAGEPNERTWLAWLVKVRIIIITFLLGIELTVTRLTQTNVPIRGFLTALLLWYTVSVFFVLLLYLWHDHRLQTRLQIFTDLCFVTVVVYLSGALDSYFVYLYPLVIIMASILLTRGLSMVTAGVAFILYAGVLELAYFGVIPAYWHEKPDLHSMQLIIVINLFAFFAIAYLSGKLAHMLRQADVRLQDATGELENLQVLHERTVESIGSGVITATLEGRVTLVNDAARKLLERDEKELLGRRIWQLFLDRLPDVTSHSEVRALTPSGQEKTFNVRTTALFVPGRGMIGCAYTFDDLTEIRRLEREVRLRDRLSAVGRLAAGIAHEIRNPLSSIAGSVRMLQAGIEPKEEQQRLLDIVHRESERLNNIVSDFLDYSRDKKYRFEPHDLATLVEETLTLLEPRARDAGVEIVRQIEGPAIAGVDGDRIRQVFWNICDNALRAMTTGGKLSVTLTGDGDAWQLQFADTGSGFDPQLADKIFEPFVSYFEGGTGLGLAIVYQILQAHSASVSVNSAPGRGTEFTLAIPRAETRAAAAAIEGERVSHG